MRIGIDIHGVIDRYPEFFAELCKCFLKQKHEIHIITGQSITQNLLKELKGLKIKYTKIHSITDYNMTSGAKIIYTDPNNPWMDADIWNSTKAKICKELKIDFLIDDSEVYGKWFKPLAVKTEYIQIR